MNFSLITLFPNFFTSPLSESILKRAKEKKLVEYSVVNIRDFSTGKHCEVDDKVYGGGQGMLLKPEEVALSIEHAQSQNPNSEVIFMSPIGEKLTQKKSYELANNGKDKIILCGHYEGIDARVLATHVDSCISVGETVVTGGEIPALMLLDSIVRLIPEVISKDASHLEESFSFELYGKGEFPQYTRPEIWREQKVPEILLSGHQKKIEEYNLSMLKNCSPAEQKMIEIRNTLFSCEKPYKTRNLLFRVPIVQDIAFWMEWTNDEEICRYTTLLGTATLEQENAYFEWQHYNLGLLMLQIIDKKTKQNIGSVSLERENAANRNSARLGIVIGKKEFWNKGVASETVSEILKIAKEVLGFHKIVLDVFADNIPAQKVYEKCGFRKVGIQEQEEYKNGKFYDLFVYEKIL